ncbi:MAG: hypothetical protein ACO2PM_00715 [Pyrobaculum sp.]|jgi:hypothetical protein
MWIVVPNPQAVIYLPLLLRTRRELRRRHYVEFYILDVTSRGLVRLTDVASMLVKKRKETADVSEEAKRHAALTAKDSDTHSHAAYTDGDIYVSNLPAPPTSKRNRYLRRSAA